jgi:hypothetical protein
MFVRSGCESRAQSSPLDRRQLAAAVAESATLAEVSRRLRLVPGRYDTLRRHIARLGLDTSHLPAVGDPRARRRGCWTDAQFAEAVRESHTVSGVLRRLGYQPSGGMHRLAVRKIANLELDTLHFTGQAWGRGLSKPFLPLIPWRNSWWRTRRIRLPPT